MSSTTQPPARLLSKDLLHDYQVKAVRFVLANQGVMLALDMGLGKTVITLTALVDLLNSLDARRILIVAPKTVAQSTWPKEIASWLHTRFLTFTDLCVPQPKRLKAVLQTTDIHIINRENVEWLTSYWGANWPYDTVVLDESSSFKSHSAKRWKALKKTRKKINRVIELTGTPTPNGLIDLWPQIYLLDEGQRLGKSITRYRQTWFDTDYWGYKFTPKLWAEADIHERINDICMSMSADDYLTMPPRIDNTIEVELPATARALYRSLEKDLLLTLGDTTITAANAAALTGKLGQLANGAIYDESGAFTVLHDAKIAALKEIIDTATGPVLVAYNYKSDLDRLKKHCGAVELDVEKWNAGQIPVMAVQPASGGYGLNLQHGGCLMVWFGLPWSLELYQQMNARLHRQGQTKTVVIHHLVAAQTVDTDIMAALGRKDMTQRKLLAAIKADMERRNT